MNQPFTRKDVQKLFSLGMRPFLSQMDTRTCKILSQAQIYVRRASALPFFAPLINSIYKPRPRWLYRALSYECRLDGPQKARTGGHCAWWLEILSGEIERAVERVGGAGGKVLITLLAACKSLCWHICIQRGAKGNGIFRGCYVVSIQIRRKNSPSLLTRGWVRPASSFA